MVNSHCSLSIKDMEAYQKMKDSTMYRDYIQDIVHSPLFRVITKEHIKYIDIKEDVAKLKEEVSLTPENLNTVFKNALTKMAIGLVADTIVMKEIIDVGIQDTKDDLDDNFKIKYLMGLADKKYYVRADKILKKNPDTDGILYKGLVEYTKRHESTDETLNISESGDETPK
ncbi:unnamed protein product, partial [marine sediment metagenome]